MGKQRSKEKQTALDRSGEGAIQARVLDFDHGLRVFDDVVLVRIKSSEYTLLIMEDYFPLLGSVSGKIELITASEQISLGEVKGFYLHRDNEFSLLIETYLTPAPEEENHVG